CTGVGGMWPNGVALVSEAWSRLSRPLVAGLIGTSANVGIFGLATLADAGLVTADSWGWGVWGGAVPGGLGPVVLFVVPESPLWLARQGGRQESGIGEARPTAPEGAIAAPVHATPPGVFRLPLLPVTLVAIALATVPLIGGWGSANWMVP